MQYTPSSTGMSGNGSPVGVVTPTFKGVIYTDNTSPAIWQATGNLSSDWIEIASGTGDVHSVFGRSGAVVAANGDYTVAEVTGAAPLVSPLFTGTPEAPTPTALSNNTELSTTAYTDSAVGVEKTRAEGVEATLLPLAGGTMTGPIIGFEDKGGQVFNVKAYGAKGDGVTDDTAAINSAIAAANVAGGTVYFPSGIFLVSSALTALSDSVILRGASSTLGFIFGDTRAASTIYAQGAATYDLISTPSATVAKGGGIFDLNIDTQYAAGGWAIHVYDTSGMRIDNVAIRQTGVNAQNGIFFDGVATGAISGVSMGAVSLCVGGGYTGGVALRVGGAAQATSNAFDMVQIIGYATGFDFNNSSGNSVRQLWCQSCTTGVRFNGGNDYVFGGWVESNSTGLVLTASSTNNIVQVRTTGNTTDKSDSGAQNKVEINGNWSNYPVSARAFRTAALTLSAAAATLFPVDTTSFDTASGWNLTTHLYTVAASGLYLVTGEVARGAANNGDRLICFIYKHGSLEAQGASVVSTGSGIAAVVTDLVTCAVGDTLAMWYYCTSADAIGGNASPYNYLSITQLSGG